MNKLLFTPEELDHACRMANRFYQDMQTTKDDLQILKDTEDDLLAQIKSDIEKEYSENGKKISEEKLKRLVLTAEEVKQFRNAKRDAIRAYGKANVKYQSWVRVWDTVQSGLAFRREGVKKGIYDYS